MLFGNSENYHRRNVWIKYLFSGNVRRALFVLVVISQVLWSENFVPIKDPIDSSILNLFFLSCSKPCDLNQNVAFEHALHSICIWEVWVY
jgi:hypothetical protein